MEFFWDQLAESFASLTDKIGAWLNSIVLQLPNLLLAILVLVIAVILSRRVNRWSNRFLDRFFTNKTINNILANILTGVFMLIMLFIILDILELEKALTSLIAGAGVVGLAVGLAVQDPLINFVSGVLMSVRDLYKVGDLVETNGYFGNIREVTLRTTLLRTALGQDVAIPNKLVIQQPLVNYSVSKRRIVDVACGISYGDDLEKVRQVVINTLVEEGLSEEGDIHFFYTGYGDSSINFEVRYPLKTHRSNMDYLKSKSQAIMAIKAAFDRVDITIPFPIRTLDFGIKGGENLSDMTVRLDQNGKKEDA